MGSIEKIKRKKRIEKEKKPNNNFYHHFCGLCIRTFYNEFFEI